MSKYFSYGHTTRNENGYDEVSIEYRRTGLQKLFRLDSTRENYELTPDGWRNKATGKWANRSKVLEIWELMQRSVSATQFF
jgi:hypothetical protein